MIVSAVLVVLIAAAGQSYADDPLSGRWEGTPPGDGTLELYLKLKDAKIDGEGRIKRAGRKPDTIFTVSGQSRARTSESRHTIRRAEIL
jgi:hypothetical protein